MKAKIIPGNFITSCHLIGKAIDDTVCVIDYNDFSVTYTGLPFDGTTVTEVIKKFYEVNGKTFELQTEPIIRIKKVHPVFDMCRYSHAVIAATINYDEGTLSYGWSVSVKEDGFNKHIGITLAKERLNTAPITIPYDPLTGVSTLIEDSGTAPQQLMAVLNNSI